MGNEPIKVKFRPLTVEAERKMTAKLEAIPSSNNKINKAVTARYAAQLVSVNDSTDEKLVHKFSENILAYDSNALKKYMDSVEPGIDGTVKLRCPNCGEEFEEQFTIGDDILKLPAAHRENVMEEIFLLTYYGKGVTRADAFRMAVTERRWHINRISEEIEKRNKAEQRAADDAKRKSKK